MLYNAFKLQTLFEITIYTIRHVNWSPPIYDAFGDNCINSTIIWTGTTTQVVSTDNNGTSYHPDIATDSQGNIHVVWYDDMNYLGSGTDADIFYRMLNSTSGLWSVIEVVSSESTFGSSNPRVAIDSKDNVHVVWEDSSDYNSSGFDTDIFYKILNTTSGLWSGTEVVTNDSFTDGNAKFVLDSQDNIHVAWYDDDNFAIGYRMKNETTGIWGSSITVSSEVGGGYNPSITTDHQDNVHIVWGDYTDLVNGISSGTDNDILYRMFNATTQLWSTTEIVSTESTGASNNPTITTDSQDNIHVAWDDVTDYLGAGTDADVFYKMLSATTQVWSTTAVVSTESNLQSSDAQIAIDHHDNVHIVWNDGSDYAGAGILNFDIFYKMYNQTTSTWTITEVVSSESTGGSYFPSLAKDNQDNLHIVWQDGTDYLGAGTDIDIFYKEYVNLNNIPFTTTQTDTQTQINTQTNNFTTTHTNTTTSTQQQVETTTVISTVFGDSQDSVAISTPWFVMPTILAFVAVEIVLQRHRNNLYQSDNLSS